MPKYPLNTDDQNLVLRKRILAYRESLRHEREVFEQAQEAGRIWREAQDRCDKLKEDLAGYVDNHVDKVVATIDGGNIACLIQFVETFGATAGVHVSFMPVFGYEPGPPVEDRVIELEPLPDLRGSYQVSGKLGSWCRRQEHYGERYLATGSQHRPVYKRIISAERNSENGYLIDVLLEGSDEPNAHGASTNTYVKN